jgi:transcription initiation factor TFIID TATA-box-binding protein
VNIDSRGICKSVEIVNVVATGELYGTVNLENLFAAAEEVHAQYDPIHHQGCYIRFKENGPLITVYNSGKYIIRAGSVNEVHNQNQKLNKYLKRIGVPPDVKQKSFELNNIVGHSDIGRELDLEALAEDLPYASPKQVAAGGRLSFSYPNSHSTISVFRSGTATIMGAKSVNGVNQIWKVFRQDIGDLFEQEDISNYDTRQ